MKRKGGAYELHQANLFTDVGCKHLAEHGMQACEMTRRSLDLSPGDYVLLTSAYSERDLRAPDSMRHLGSVMTADSTPCIWEERLAEIGADTAEEGRFHVFAQLETIRGRAFIYELILDTRTDRLVEIRRVDGDAKR